MQRTSDAQVRFTYARIDQELRSRAAPDGLAVGEDEGAVGHLERLRDVLLDEHHGHAGFADRRDDLEDSIDDDGREPERRLVRRRRACRPSAVRVP